MIDLGRFNAERRKVMFRLRERIRAIGLAGDRVIPVQAIKNTLDPGCQVEAMDFPFEYSHENPFPAGQNFTGSSVDRMFDNVFKKVCRFLE
jgi:hypothetical protein